MIAYARLLLIIFFSVADVFFGFSFYFRWNQYKRFGMDLLNYNFVHSMFEFWLFSMLRMIMLSSATLGVITEPQEILSFIKDMRYAVGVMNILVVLYTLAKIMLYTEYLDGNHDDDPWFLTFGAWTMVASLIMYVIWIHILKEPLYSNSGEKEGIEGSRDIKDDHAIHGGELEKVKNYVKWQAVFVRLMSYAKPDWLFLLGGIISIACFSVGNSFVPFWIGQAVDGVLAGNQSEFHKAIVLLILISLFTTICVGLRIGLLNLAMARLNRRINNCLFDSIIKQDITFFDENSTGAILSRLSLDTTTMSNSLGQSFRISTLKIFNIVFSTVAMVILSWRLSVIIILNLVFLAVITDLVGTYYDKLARKVQSALALANIIAEEIISNIKTFRCFDTEKNGKSTYSDKLDSVYHLRMKEAVAVGTLQVVVSTSKLVAFILALFYGSHLVLFGKMSGGTFVSFVLYQRQIGNNIATMFNGFSHIMRAAGASRKVFELIDLTHSSAKKGSLMPEEFDGQLEFKDVTFAYPASQSIPVLRNINFTASPGKMLAIVGPSGGGKSSCIELIKHFYDCTSGEILLDGNNINQYTDFYLNKKTAFVGQEPVVYAKTIKDNISHGLENCSLERIHNAAKLANIHDFIVGLKKGYETEAGEKGFRLSGGQKQRVAIARALVRNPQILLLDGATSALDAENEHLVLEAILEKKGCPTVVIVTNCLSTMEKADRIVVIDDGMVVEQGDHQELMSANRLYAHLQRHQLRWLKNGDHEIKCKHAQIEL
ncbi:ABC-type oligopeptide transporter ABCB9-like [Lytechinus pictus]|uniref:ABC-type oligopeptide transporter ABCB9-like n=1 Tax=Lytechinus pictus TaxID=7653 RepID=UPI0030B9BA0A